MVQSITIRRAVREDCPALLALVRDLAAFERAAHEVSVTLEHFTESGFGPHPVWWAFVAEAEGQVAGFALLAWAVFALCRGEEVREYVLTAPAVPATPATRNTHQQPAPQ